MNTLVYKFFESIMNMMGKVFYGMTLWFEIFLIFVKKKKNYYFAYGSNQKVYVKKVPVKAKKTHSLINEAIESNEKLDVNSKWRKVFGKTFPNAIKVITESFDESQKKKLE